MVSPSISRRNFLRSAATGAVGCLGVGGSFACWEMMCCEVRRETITLPVLPRAFDGLRIAFLADTHHGPLVSAAYLRDVVALANSLEPDLIALGGDYVQRQWRVPNPGEPRPYVAEGIGVLGGLRAPLGVFAVLGNHDNTLDHKSEIKTALAENGVCELTNRGVWIEKNHARPSSSAATSARLRVCGLDEMLTGKPTAADLDNALGDATRDDTVILLQHNPDFAESLRDPRVSLMLSGHTHGGQVVLPFLGAPIVPSVYGQKYRDGVVKAPMTTVFVTRGVGAVFPPVRFRCPPEVALLTLRSA